MSPTDSVFLFAESRDQPMHVGGLQVFHPADGMERDDVLDTFQQMLSSNETSPMFGKRVRRSIRTGWLWAWEEDERFDIEHHVRHNALPRPGRVLDLFALCSRLHGSLLDRHRPLWETHLIEGLHDGRFAVYTKVHHSLTDGVSAIRLMQSSLSDDPEFRGGVPPWRAGVESMSPRRSEVVAPASRGPVELSSDTLRTALRTAGEAAALPLVLARSVNRGLHAQSGPLAFTAPKMMFNVPITGARRFAAQSWAIERFQLVAKRSDCSLNDVVLAMCSGALRRYLLSLQMLPQAPLIAMVPVSLRDESTAPTGGNSVGAVMCNLATQLDDPGQRLSAITQSMRNGKQALASMTQLQILAMTALAVSPLGIDPLLRLTGVVRPPFNLIISNVPGPRSELYWNGSRMSGLYPLSIPVDGQALNISCVSHAEQLSFGLTGCRRTVPHLQRLLSHLDDELVALELATA
nr:wax ester/triacylglycerol synthase family O-acyltransferase [Jatrophihabitans sp. GAS493]